MMTTTINNESSVLMSELPARIEDLFQIPYLVDKTPDGELVEKADVGTEGYAENIEYRLQVYLSEETQSMVLEYIGEDGSKLSLDEVISVLENY